MQWQLIFGAEHDQTTLSVLSHLLIRLQSLNPSRIDSFAVWFGFTLSFKCEKRRLRGVYVGLKMSFLPSTQAWRRRSRRQINDTVSFLFKIFFFLEISSLKRFSVYSLFLFILRSTWYFCNATDLSRFEACLIHFGQRVDSESNRFLFLIHFMRRVESFSHQREPTASSRITFSREFTQHGESIQSRIALSPEFSSCSESPRARKKQSHFQQQAFLGELFRIAKILNMPPLSTQYA